MRNSISRPLALVLGLALFTSACGDGETAGSTVTTEAPTTSATEMPATTTTSVSSTTTAPTTTTTTVATSTTTAGPTTTTVAGEPVDLGPLAGDVLGVVGVRHDDVLNVRSGPGVGYSILTGLDPLEDDVVAKGDTWYIPGAFWIEVEAGGVEGWVNLRYVAYLGDTDDMTSRLIADLGERPEAETMLDLGMIVAEAVAFEGEGARDPVVSVAPSVGDLGEVTIDVLGSADDSIGGYRLHVFGMPSESGEGFVLGSVEATVFCSRGVSGGVCI
jgi:hypothetical protein